MQEVPDHRRLQLVKCSPHTNERGGYGWQQLDNSNLQHASREWQGHVPGREVGLGDLGHVGLQQGRRLALEVGHAAH